MARVSIPSGFAPTIPEGKYVFRIYEAKYDEEYGRIEVKMVNSKGMTHTEKFFVMNNDNTPNERALNAFGFFARTAMQDYTLEDIDPEELVDRYIKVDIVHNKVPNRNDPSKEMTFVNLGGKYQADGFEDKPVARALTLGKEEPLPSKGLDLDALLG